MNAVSEAYDSVFQHNLGLIRLYESSSLMVNDLTARLAEEVAKTAAAVAEVEDLKTRLAASDALVTSAAAAAVAAIDEEEVVIDLTSESEASEASEAGEAGEAGEAVAPVKKARRESEKLPTILTEGTKLSITSTGDRWDGSYSKDGFIFQNNLFKSPCAVCTAHAQRITERHPKATKGGSGWCWIRIEDGTYKGKTLGEAYDAHFA